MKFLFLFLSHFWNTAHAGKIGIYYHLLDKNILDGNGIVVDEVIHNSPADISGLETGDWILSVNGKSVFEDDLYKKIRIASQEGNMVLCVKKAQTEPIYKDQITNLSMLQQHNFCTNITIQQIESVQNNKFIEDIAHQKYLRSKKEFLSFFLEQDAKSQQAILAYLYQRNTSSIELDTDDLDSEIHPLYLLQVAIFHHKRSDWSRLQRVLRDYEELLEWNPENIYPSYEGFVIKIDALIKEGKTKNEIIQFIERNEHEYYAPEIWKRYAMSATSQNINITSMPLEDFFVTLSSGQKWYLSEQNGKTTILLFWATWCGPCRAELREVQNIFKQHSDISFLAVSVDEKPSSYVYGIAKKWGLTIPVTHNRKLGRMFDVSSLPTMHVIDQNGVWKESHTGYSSTVLQKVLRSKNTENLKEIGKIYTLSPNTSEITYHFFPASYIEDIFVYDEQLWYTDHEKRFKNTIQDIETTSKTTEQKTPIQSIQMIKTSNSSIALSKDIQCHGLSKTIRCEGIKTWYQNTKYPIEDMFIENDQLFVVTILDVLSYDIKGKLLQIQKRSKNLTSHPMGFDLNGGSYFFASPYEIKMAQFDWNKDRILDRVILVSGVGLLVLEGTN